MNAEATRSKGITTQMLEPTGDRLIIERDSPDKYTEGGIELPDCAQDQPSTGTVLAVGPGRRSDIGGRCLMPFKPGDRVLMAPYVTTVHLEGYPVVIAKEEDILAIIRNAK